METALRRGSGIAVVAAFAVLSNFGSTKRTGPNVAQTEVGGMRVRRANTRITPVDHIVVQYEQRLVPQNDGSFPETDKMTMEDFERQLPWRKCSSISHR
jgi:hypothetical protein